MKKKHKIKAVLGVSTVVANLGFSSIIASAQNTTTILEPNCPSFNADLLQITNDVDFFLEENTTEFRNYALPSNQNQTMEAKIGIELKVCPRHGTRKQIGVQITSPFSEEDNISAPLFNNDINLRISEVPSLKCKIDHNCKTEEIVPISPGASINLPTLGPIYYFYEINHNSDGSQTENFNASGLYTGTLNFKVDIPPSTMPGYYTNTGSFRIVYTEVL